MSDLIEELKKAVNILEELYQEDALPAYHTEKDEQNLHDRAIETIGNIIIIAQKIRKSFETFHESYIGERDFSEKRVRKDP